MARITYPIFFVPVNIQLIQWRFLSILSWSSWFGWCLFFAFCFMSVTKIGVILWEGALFLFFVFFLSPSICYFVLMNAILSNFIYLYHICGHCFSAHSSKKDMTNVFIYLQQYTSSLWPFILFIQCIFWSEPARSIVFVPRPVPSYKEYNIHSLSTLTLDLLCVVCTYWIFLSPK